MNYRKNRNKSLFFSANLHSQKELYGQERNHKTPKSKLFAMIAIRKTLLVPVIMICNYFYSKEG